MIILLQVCCTLYLTLLITKAFLSLRYQRQFAKPTTTDLEPNYNLLDPAIKDKILFAYHDNELALHQTQWYDLLSLAKNIMDKPIYQLNGNPGNTANFNDFIDVSGAYVTKDGRFKKTDFAVLDHQNNLNVLSYKI